MYSIFKHIFKILYTVFCPFGVREFQNLCSTITSRQQGHPSAIIIKGKQLLINRFSTPPTPVFVTRGTHAYICFILPRR